MYVIVGLGNFGAKYERTRHNVGFDAVNYIASQYRIANFKLKHKALVSEGIIQGKKVMLVKPQTYMNNSGEAVSEIMAYYKVPAERLIIIYDDIDLDVGCLRIRAKGSAGSHNGMRSIIQHIKTQCFPRIRIGISKPPEKMDLADYVLSKFSDDERTIINKTIEDVSRAAATILLTDVELAMSKYNA